MEYRDFLSLLKLESKWLIVNKVFHSNSMQINKTAEKQNGETEMKHKKTDDIDLIIKTVQYYIDAVTNIELSKVKKAWHTNGQRIFVDKKSNEIVFLESPVKDDVKKIESALKNTKQRCMIESINKKGTSATARIKWFVESPDWIGTEINFLSLLKREDKWEIVGKIAHKD
ncbi:MAG: nuclear transport factor 2 family protein [Candidatus Heimdallarchaeota archaeon]|nr:nuclear transport factor 2 family protein [Candidatus Heimdallarchaeota archaeon]MCK4770347.1 nuclear transport factor 2 family protein [Candidatus Heimdallarchaeota archaeon]